MQTTFLFCQLIFIDDVILDLSLSTKIFSISKKSLKIPTVESEHSIYIPAAPAYGVYISPLIRNTRACGSYYDFLDRVLLLTRKLLNQRFLVVKLNPSLRQFYGRNQYLVNHNLVFSSFMTYHRHCSKKRNTTGATSGAPEFTPSFSGACVA